jgi:hypothetical protein
MELVTFESDCHPALKFHAILEVAVYKAQRDAFKMPSSFKMFYFQWLC